MRFGAKPADAAYGAFQRGLYVTAYNLALAARKNGDPAAQTLVAEILSRGLGVQARRNRGREMVSLAAEQGIPEAQFQYALMLLDGRYVKRDKKAAYALLEASAEAGNVLAQFNFAQLIVDREPGEAGMRGGIPYYERAANAGLRRRAIRDVADLRQRRRRQEARRRRGAQMAGPGGAAGFRHRPARSRHLDGLGRGGERDARSGFAWLKRAAEGGNVAAQNRVAKLYMQGIGTDPDTIFAAAWYILARRAGLFDPEMDDFFNGLTPEEMKTGDRVGPTGCAKQCDPAAC